MSCFAVLVFRYNRETGKKLRICQKFQHHAKNLRSNIIIYIAQLITLRINFFHLAKMDKRTICLSLKIKYPDNDWLWLKHVDEIVLVRAGLNSTW